MPYVVEVQNLRVILDQLGQFIVKFSVEKIIRTVANRTFNIDHLSIDFMVLLLSVVRLSMMSWCTQTRLLSIVLAAYGSIAALDFTYNCIKLVSRTRN